MVDGLGYTRVRRNVPEPSNNGERHQRLQHRLVKRLVERLGFLRLEQRRQLVRILAAAAVVAAAAAAAAANGQLSRGHRGGN